MIGYFTEKIIYYKITQKSNLCNSKDVALEYYFGKIESHSYE